MSEKRSVLYSVFNFRCPRCRKGEMFPSGTLFSINKFDKMHAKCQNCGLSFEPEPGYYFGAMFISYALNAALFIAIWLVMTYINEDVSLFWIIGVIIVLSLLLLPFIFRLSRSLWISIFIPFQGNGK
ncbi:DUF983 domain-containing protein [Anditalea andensis]|uniref:DUF983 domain-containing protein n=1 Tax=Anditalea andensis TaxID=1048983 RepID=A0A074L2Y5_9BACT|nr:DUF983 domain-containing protein [Anditalea andensis]KEO75544.1 hypothetical protein EL17_00170 [Anditalea andensis]